jgi:hypothetical protein
VNYFPDGERAIVRVKLSPPNAERERFAAMRRFTT